MDMKRDKTAMGDGTLEWSVTSGKGAVNLLVFPEKTAIQANTTAVPVVIGIHGKTPYPGGQERARCDLLPEGRCFTSLMSSPEIAGWEQRAHGDDQVIWRKLEWWHARTFG
jgi:hypothetical protein